MFLLLAATVANNPAYFRTRSDRLLVGFCSKLERFGGRGGKRNPKVDGLKEIADEVLTFNGKTTVSV